MLCTTSEAEGEVRPLKLVYPPPANTSTLLTVPRRQFCCGSLLPGFGVRVSVTFHLMFVHIILVRVVLPSGHLLGKSCSIRLTVCSLCILTICIFIFFLVLVLRAGFGF